jgi:hypothetical protein
MGKVMINRRVGDANVLGKTQNDVRVYRSAITCLSIYLSIYIDIYIYTCVCVDIAHITYLCVCVHFEAITIPQHMASPWNLLHGAPTCCQE